MLTCPEAPHSTDRRLVITRTFDAPRSLVFKAWTEPERLIRWWIPRGFTVASYAVNLRPGGAYRFRLRPSAGGDDIWLRGVYREILEPERLAFTLDRVGGDADPDRGTLVTITFDEHGGNTTMNLCQSLLESGSASIGDADREHELRRSTLLIGHRMTVRPILSMYAREASA